MASTDDRILEYVTFSAGIERADLARALGLPVPTVVSAVRRLLSTGALTEEVVSREPAGRGRPATLLRGAGPIPLLGLISWQDGEVRASCLRFDGSETAEVAARAPFPVTTADDLDEPVSVLRDLAAREDGHALRAVVVSVPAPLLGGRDPRTAGPSFAVLAPRNWAHDLTDRHRIRFFTENDANLAALGEHRAGSGRGGTDFVYLKINTVGFGCAIVANGEVIRGAHGFAGELAHVQVDADGPLCICGGRGCLRTQVHRLVVETAQAAYRRPITFADLPRLAGAGDAGAIRMLHDIGGAIGRPLAQLCTFLDPDRVVVDSSIGAVADHVLDGLRAAFAAMAPPAIRDHVEIVISELGAAGERRGALEIVREHARVGRAPRDPG